MGRSLTGGLVRWISTRSVRISFGFTPRTAFRGGRKTAPVSCRLQRPRSQSLAFHEGNIAFSKEIALLPSPGAYSNTSRRDLSEYRFLRSRGRLFGPGAPPSPFTREMQLFPMKSPLFTPLPSPGAFSDRSRRDLSVYRPAGARGRLSGDAKTRRRMAAGWSGPGAHPSPFTREI